MAWSKSAPTLPSGSSWGGERTAVLSLNFIRVDITMKTARGVGSKYYVSISAEFSKGTGGTYQPENPMYFFVGSDYKAYSTPSAPSTIKRYYTGSGGATNAFVTEEAGVSRKEGSYLGSGVAAHNTVQVPPIMTYDVKYNANGGAGTTSSQVKVSGQSLTLRNSGFTRSGYTFVRWNTKANGSGTSYSAGGTYTANADVTLYAQWEAIPPEPVNIPAYVNSGSAVRQAEKAFVNNGGTIKEAEVYVNENGTIKKLGG